MTAVTPKLVFITGATSGIGQATARRMASFGADLILLGRRKDRLETLKKELKNVTVHIWPVDLQDIQTLDKGAAERKDLLAKVDVLVNNAGLAIGKEPLHGSDPADWDRMIDTNLKGLLHTTRLVLGHMVARGDGHIVNLGSITGRQVYRGGTVYAATKFGVRAITEALRHDVLGTGVRVSSIDPGMVRTEFSVVRFGGDKKAADEVYKGMRPLTPDDVADAIAWTVTRPAHVNVQEILLMPTDQAAVQLVHRTGA
jgi:NADP-dependent 3-hydroxy acid dehydrogenase YdfG